MSAESATLYAVHLLFAGLWAGSVLFVTAVVLPLGGDGAIDAAPLEAIAGKLTWITRASAVLLLLTGLRMGMLGGYWSTDGLFGSINGYLVVVMIVLWFVMAGLVEVGSSKLTDGTGKKKVREPAKNAKPFLYGASAAAVALLLTAGALTGGI